MNPEEQTSVKFESKYDAFHSKKGISQCRLQNGGHLFRPQYDKPSDAVQRTCWNDRDLNEERLDAKCGHICDGDNTIGAITPPSEFRTQWLVLSPSSHPSLYSTLRPTTMKMYGNKCAVLLAMTCVVFNTLRPEQTGLPRLTLRSLYSCPRTGIVDPTTEMAMSSFWRNFRPYPSEVHSDHWQFNKLQGEYGLNVKLFLLAMIHLISFVDICYVSFSIVSFHLT